MPFSINLRSRVLVGAGLLAVLLGGGSAWYAIVEGFSPLDAIYQVVVTISTVGFSEVQPLDTSGKLFTIVLILGGVGVVYYLATSAVEHVVTGTIGEAFGWQLMNRKIDRLHDHVVLCGYGRVGRAIAQELSSRAEQLVVVDRAVDRLQAARANGLLTVLGDATEESVLRDAHVDTARVLVAASDSDAGNVFIALTARALRPQLFIIARAGTESAERRLRAAGANRVLSPFLIAGRRMALAAMQPQIVDFLDTMYGGSSGPALLAEFVIDGDSIELSGVTIDKAFEATGGTQVLGVVRAGELIISPPGDTTLASGDRLLVYGDQAVLEQLSALVPPGGE